MKLSVIIPFYNTNPCYLKECLDSIYSQSFSDFKIILINDGSTKYNYSKYISTDPKILYLKNEFNSGIGRTVNRAFSHVDSEYCVRIDSDDIIDPSLFQKEVEFLDSNPNYIGVCCELSKFGDREKYVKRPEVWNIEDVKNKKYRGYGYAGGMMFRSSVLSSISLNESLPICEDFDFHLKLMKFGKIFSIHEPLYKYRKHGIQVTKKYTKIQRHKIIKEIIGGYNESIYNHSSI